MSYKLQVFVISGGILAGLAIASAMQLTTILLLPFLYLIYYVFFCLAATRKRQVVLFLIASLSFIVTIVNGAVMDALARLLMDLMVYFLVGIALMRFPRQHLSFIETFFLLFAPRLLIFIPFFLDADIHFKPLTIDFFLPLFALSFVYRTDAVRLSLAIYTPIAIFIAYFLYPNYMQAMDGKRFKTVDSRTNLPIITSNGDTVTIQSMGEKIVVVDVWYSRCGVCFQKFPELDRLHNLYKDDSNVVIAALNIPLQDEMPSNSAFTLVQKYNFVRLKATTPIDQNLWHIDAYPTVLIFDKKKQLRYAGSVNFDKNVVVDNTINLIEALRDD